MGLHDGHNGHNGHNGEGGKGGKDDEGDSDEVLSPSPLPVRRPRRAD